MNLKSEFSALLEAENEDAEMDTPMENIGDK